MDEERRGDPRIYVVMILFFLCILSGGVLLSLYEFLNPNNVKSWYPTAGLILVGIPWVFWLLVYAYRCIRPTDDTLRNKQPSISSERSHSAFVDESSPISPRNQPSVTSPRQNQPSTSDGGARHVHFGGVVIVDCSINDEPQQKSTDGMEELPDDRNNSGNGKESEMPLAPYGSHC